MTNDGKDKDLSLFEKQQIITKHLQRINHVLLDTIPQGKFLKEQMFPYDIRLLGTLENSQPVMINYDKEVSFTNRRAIERLVHVHLDGMIPYWQMSNMSVKEIVSYFLKECEILHDDQIQTISELSEDTLCFKKIDFDLLDMMNEETPMFDEIMERWENSEEFMKFVGMLMGPGGLDQQKYVWVYGEGGAGKGCIQRILHDVLGQSATSMTGKMFNSRFGLSMVVGKRLVSFSDEMNDQFIKDGNMMAHTGGDASIVEFKGQTPYATKLRFLPMIYSNYEPEITRGEHVRRCIFVKAEAAKDQKIDTSYEIKLAKEAPGWIGKCYFKFLNDPIFAKNDSYAQDLANANMEWADVFVADYLDITDSEMMRTPKAKIKMRLQNLGKSASEIKDFFTYFESKWQTTTSVMKVNKRTVRAYKGVKFREFMG